MVGKAFVFERSGGTWSQAQQLGPGDNEYQGQFGNSVAVDGDTVVVGAFRYEWPRAGKGGCAMGWSSFPESKAGN